MTVQHWDDPEIHKALHVLLGLKDNQKISAVWPRQLQVRVETTSKYKHGTVDKTRKTTRDLDVEWQDRG